MTLALDKLLATLIGLVLKTKARGGGPFPQLPFEVVDFIWELFDDGDDVTKKLLVVDVLDSDFDT